MARRDWFLPELALTVVSGTSSSTTPDWHALGRRWWSHVQVLADDKMEGRETGSRGYQRAADYVVERFRAAGLKPAGVDGYRQPVDLQVTQIDPARCSLESVLDGKVHPIRLGEHAAIVVGSQTQEVVDAEAVFVGYGLAVPELGYDDLAGQDVRGKIAVPGTRWAHGDTRTDQGALSVTVGAPESSAESRGHRGGNDHEPDGRRLALAPPGEWAPEPEDGIGPPQPRRVRAAALLRRVQSRACGGPLRGERAHLQGGRRRAGFGPAPTSFSVGREESVHD